MTDISSERKVEMTTSQVSMQALPGESLDMARQRLEKQRSKAATISDLAVMIENQEADMNQAEAHGAPALMRLMKVASSDTGQAGICALFLLGLYDGARYPFNLRELRGLDASLHEDCLAVLQMDYAPHVDIHEHFENDQAVWDFLVSRWSHRVAGRSS